MVAQHPALRGAVLKIPILARVDSDDWDNTNSQTLFTSLVGFPAGNFFEENYFGGVNLFNGKTEAVYSFMTGPDPEPVISIDESFLMEQDPNSKKFELYWINEGKKQWFKSKQDRENGLKAIDLFDKASQGWLWNPEDVNVVPLSFRIK